MFDGLLDLCSPSRFLVEMFYDRGNHYEFTSLVKEMAPAGEITSDIDYDFDFSAVEKQYESYNGINVRLRSVFFFFFFVFWSSLVDPHEKSLRYFLRFTINVKKAISNISKELDFWVHNFQTEPEINNSIKMEVGIEDCLHIEFEYNKSKYHLKVGDFS